MKLKKADPAEQKVVISGCGAAGSSIIRMLYNYGFHKIYAFDIEGCVDPDRAGITTAEKRTSAICQPGSSALCKSWQKA
jgi:malic enzyme